MKRNDRGVYVIKASRGGEGGMNENKGIIFIIQLLR